MRSKDISVPGLAIATLICLVATGMALSDAERYAPLALALFSFAWLVFYIAVAMPFTVRKKSQSKD